MSTVARINAEINLRDNLSRPLSDAGKNVKKFADNASKDIDELKRKSLASWKSLADSLGSFGQKATLAGGAITLGLTAPIIGLAKASVDAAGKMEAIRASMTSITGSAAVAGSQLAELEAMSKRTASSYDLLVRASQGLIAGFDGDVAGANRVLEKFAVLSNVLGVSRTDFERLVINLTQIGGASKLTGDELREMASILPILRTLLKDAFGENQTEKLAKMGITGREALEGIARAIDARGFKANTQTYNAQLQALSTEFFKLKVAAGEALLPLAKQVVEFLTPAFEKLAKAIKDLNPEQKRMVLGFTAAVAAIGPVLVVLGTLSLSLKTTVTSVLALRTAMILLSGASRVAAGAITSSQLVTQIQAVGIASNATTAGMMAGWAAAALPLIKIVAIIAAVVGAAYLLKKAWDAAVNSGIATASQIEEVRKRQTALIKEQAKNSEAVRSLALEYNGLLAKKKRTVEETLRLNKVFDQIAAISPTLVKGYDAQGNAIHGLTESYQGLAKAAAEAAEAQRKSAFAETFRPQLEGAVDQLSAAQDRLAEIKANGVREIIGYRNRTVRKMMPDADGRLVPTDVPSGGQEPIYQFTKEGAAYTKALASAKLEVERLEAAMGDLKNSMVAESKRSRGFSGPIGRGSSGGSAPVTKTAEAKELKFMDPFSVNPKLKEQIERDNRLTEEAIELAKNLTIERMKAAGAALGDVIAMEKFGKLYSELNDDYERRYVNRARDLELYKAEQAESLRLAEVEKARLEASRRARIELNNSVLAAAANLNRERMSIRFTTEEERARWETSVGGYKSANAFAKALYITNARLLDQARAAKAFAENWRAFWSDIIAKGKEWVSSQREQASERYEEYLKRLTEDLLKLSGAQDKVVASELFEQFKGASAGMPGMVGLFKVLGMVSKVMSDIKRNDVLREKIERIKEVAREIEDIFNRSLNDLFERGFKAFFSSVLGGFRDLAREIAAQFLRIQLMRALIWGAGQMFGAGAKTDIRKALPGLASGGSAFAGTPYIVGERGPEVFVPNVSGRVIPRDESGRVGSTTNSTSIVLNLNVPNYSAFKRSEAQLAALAFARATRARSRSGY